MTRTSVITAAVLFGAALSSSPAFAGPCAEQIKQLEEQAKATDAKNSPGSQETPRKADGQPSAAAPGPENGGTKSASAKILEAKARDGRKDEPGCMQALEEAKKLIGS